MKKEACKDKRALASRGFEILCKIVLCVFFFRFAVIYADYLSRVQSLSAVLLFVQATLNILFTLIRELPKKISTSLFAWLAAIFAVFLPLLFRPIPSGETLAEETLGGHIIQILGMLTAILALCSLNKSFAVVAAKRTLKTEGLYRMVRHPLYLGYILTYLGFWLNNQSPANSLLLLVWLPLCGFRIAEEERLLLSDPDYQDYASRTRWRIIPFVY